MPDALDLLTICVEAGLGFDAAMQKVAEKWDNELSRAFSRTVQEMQLGKLRREALRDMAGSMDVPDVTSFTAAIIQADQLGVSMAKVMRIQSDTMRMKRRQRAEEKSTAGARQDDDPAGLFIFPTILIVLLGPALIQIRDSGVFSARSVGLIRRWGRVCAAPASPNSYTVSCWTWFCHPGVSSVAGWRRGCVARARRSFPLPTVQCVPRCGDAWEGPVCVIVAERRPFIWPRSPQPSSTKTRYEMPSTH